MLGVCVGRGSDARVGGQPDLWRWTSELARVWRGRQEVGGVELEGFLAHAHLTELIGQLVDRCRWGIVNRFLTESGGIDVLGFLRRRRVIWWRLLSGEALLCCETGGKELSTRRWLLLNTGSTIGGLLKGVAGAVVSLCLTGSVLATLGVGMARWRRRRGSVRVYGRGWDLRGRLPLGSSSGSLCPRSA